jgi:leucyl/phenylalanyl-tRNA--protein transferase
MPDRAPPPVEPPPSTWYWPALDRATPDGVIGVGADLEPGTLLSAYRGGIFPMPIQRRGPMAWWSPDPRGVLPLHRLRLTRSLRASCRRYQIRLDTAFDEVVEACADPRRPGGWITDEIRTAYGRLHRLGWAHSVEAWSREDPPRLVGGLYGVAIGGLFAGESMFHRARDGSKVALVGLVEVMRAAGPAGRLLDVQWLTPHLASLGAVEVSRPEYLALLDRALQQGLPSPFGGRRAGTAVSAWVAGSAGQARRRTR